MQDSLPLSLSLSLPFLSSERTAAAGIRTPDSLEDLKNAKRIALESADRDVLGEGTVIIKTAFGRTPGQQMLFLRPAKFGALLLAGVPYVLPEEGPRAGLRFGLCDDTSDPQGRGQICRADRRQAVDPA